MTLSTDVYVLDEVDPGEVFRFCQGLLAQHDDQHRLADAQAWGDKQDETWRDGEPVAEPGNPWTMANEGGQGLPAWLMLHYRPGEPLTTPEQAAACDDDCQSDPDYPCDGKHYRRACWLSLDFDTAYGYSDSKGMGCGDLHAVMVADLGNWLTERGVRWEWRNEFTGEVSSDPARLIELVSDGFAASAWFHTTALPLILATTGGDASQS